MLFDLARPLLFALDAESAHGLTLKALKARSLLPAGRTNSDPSLRSQVFGLDFPNPLGIAAGFDKHGEAPDALLKAGFGFTETGTVTPLPQPGNPRPRLFRLVEDEGVINRFGFNSEGQSVVHARLAARAHRGGIIGINIGANKDSVDRVADYVTGIEAFADVVSYFTINISSPNTPGLRDLQKAAVLDDLLTRVIEARDRCAQKHRHKPLLLKISPDLTDGDLDDIVRVCRTRGIDGMIVGNTTTSRAPGLRSAQAKEAGGLSGLPLFAMSTSMLAKVYLRVEGQFPIIGAGGIHDARSAINKIEAGATLLQIYSMLVFRGPALIGEILDGLSDWMTRENVTSLTPLTGRRASDWSGRTV